MAFTDIFIRRPILSIVTSLLLLLLGIQSASQLALREYPYLETGTVEVSTVYPGASAGVVLGFVTTPLQRYIAQANGIDYITSTSSPGSSRIVLHLRLGEDTRAVLSEVIAKINEARYELPREIEDPVLNTSSTGDALMYIGFQSKELSIPEVNDYLARAIQPVLTTIEGVGEAQILGNQGFAMRVWLNPDKMAAHGVTAEDVRDALRRENYLSASGTTEGQFVQASVRAATDISEPMEFEEIVIRQNGDLRVLLKDVSKVELTSQNIEFSSFSNGKPTVFIAVKLAAGANPLDVASKVKTTIPTLEEQMPADIRVFYDSDSSRYISEALYEVSKTMFEAILIVSLIVYLFLGSLRVVVIPLVTIPLSLIGVLFFMYLAGFSINLLTLLAMVIAIGLVVDDAIVVVENVHRHIEDGASRLDAALLGARQVALPVVVMTLTLVAVYAPIGFLGGLTGALFTEFALTLAGAVVISGIAALILSPMMSAHLLRETNSQARFATWLDERFRSLRGFYKGLLQYSLDNRGAVFLFGLAIIGSLPILYSFSQEELAPNEDSGQVFYIANAPSHSNLDYIKHFLPRAAAIGLNIPEVAHIWQVGATERIMGGFVLAPWRERERIQQEIHDELQPLLNEVSGLEFLLFSESRLPGSQAGLPINFAIATNENFRSLDRVAERLVQRARESGLFIFVTKTLKLTRPEVMVSIDRDKAARLGVSMQSIGDTLAIMLGEAEVNRFSMEGRSYKVIPQAAPDFRLTSDELEKYYVRTTAGALIPLTTVVGLDQRVEPNSLTQYQQLNSSNIIGMMMPPHSMQEGLSFLKKSLAEIAPSGYRAGYEGQSRRFIQESSSFPLLFGISLTVIFLVLAAQFNSFRDPLVVLIAVPMSIFGAMVPIALGVVSFNIYTQIGLLTLVGLISKHGILIINFANELRSKGMPSRDAVLEASSLRLRPILMTTAATVIGVTPLLYASGAGANSRFGIGLMIAAGMLVGTLFTLFVVPAFYLPWLARKSGATLEETNPQPARV